MAADAREVSVVIVNWNSGDDLGPCLASIERQRRGVARVIVVDNASTDGSLERAAARLERVELLRLTENRGFTGGANRGIAQVRPGHAVLVMNPDAWLDPGYLEFAVPALERPRTGFVAGKILRADGRTLDSAGQGLSPFLRRVVERGYGEQDVGQFETPGPVGSVCGAVALYGPRLLERLAPRGQLFDESFFAFWEDADVGARAGRAGLKGYYEPRAIAYHKRGGTRRSDGRLFGRSFQILGRDAAIQYHVLKNRYLFLAKNEPLTGLLVRLPLLVPTELGLLILLALRRPRLLRRLLGIGPLLREAIAKRRDPGR